jgi:hypothetical protein
MKQTKRALNLKHETDPLHFKANGEDPDPCLIKDPITPNGHVTTIQKLNIL